ncbi:MAG: addiction module antidote protein, HigA family [Acinetobacter sp.]|jgi:addiction module HigA family antidote|nr:MAG: addiction module antidote protein, HigA family [Acinetobacter sp.]
MTINLNELHTIDFNDVADLDAPLIPHIHAGKYLEEEFLIPLGITKYRLAKDTGIPASRIGEIVAGKRAITTDTALRLAKYLGTTAYFWTNLQASYDLEMTTYNIQDELNRIHPCMAYV